MKPSKPDHKVEGARVGNVEMMVSMVLRGSTEAMDEVDDDDDSPGKAHEPSIMPHEAPHDPNSVQVEPGGETVARRSGSAAHEDADGTTDSRAEEAHSDVQFEVGGSATCQNVLIKGERGSTLAQGQSTTTDKLDNQHSEMSINNIPRAPPEPPPPVLVPYGPAQR